MIKVEYRQWKPDSEFDSMVGPPTVEQVTMTLGDDVSWDEAVCEFHNFLRAAGYVIPYDFEEKEEREWVGLTQEELQDLCVKSYHTDNTGETHFNRGYFADAIEDKLKEKNT